MNEILVERLEDVRDIVKEKVDDGVIVSVAFDKEEGDDSVRKE